MAITRVWQSGLESGSISEFDAIVSNTGIQASAPYTGTYRMYVNARDAGYGRIFVPATRQVRGSFVIAFTHYGTVTGNGNLFELVAAGTPIATVGWNAFAEKTSHDINQYVNSSWQGATTNHPLNYPVWWIRITYDAKIDNAAGWFKVWINGELAFNYSGNTGNVDLDEVRIGTSVQGSINSVTWFYDDIYVDDTTGESSPANCPPHYRYPAVLPDGVGNYSQWTPSAGNNWQCVDERPPSEADYVDIGAVDQFDSYTMTGFTLGTGKSIDSVIPIGYVKRDEATEEIALGTRYAATDLVGSDQAPGAASDYFWERQTTKPGGGAWDQAALTGFEALIKSRGSY